MQLVYKALQRITRYTRCAKTYVYGLTIWFICDLAYCDLLRQCGNLTGSSWNVNKFGGHVNIYRSESNATLAAIMARCDLATDDGHVSFGGLLLRPLVIVFAIVSVFVQFDRLTFATTCLQLGFPMEIYAIANGRVLSYILDPNFEKYLPIIPSEVSQNPIQHS